MAWPKARTLKVNLHPLDSRLLDAYIVGIVPVQSPLGEFEVVVLMAVLHLGPGAFASAIRAEIEQRTGRSVSRGSIYITLDRLEEKSLLTSTLGNASADRGGRPRRLFKITARGIAGVKRSVVMFASMHKGLEPLVGDL